MNFVLYADGYLKAGENVFPAVYGRGGIGLKHKEGDGISPEGTWSMRRIFYRPDRIQTLSTGLPLHSLTPLDGWCDEVGDPKYNQYVTLPYNSSHESLWRPDALYDIIVVLGYNDDPIVKGKGSAIFLHVFRSSELPTAGCAAISHENLKDLVPQLTSQSQLTFTSKTLKGEPVKWPYQPPYN
jgi:L,D-peptidoglycan transpeptidase YkuD (ErfK/YbiS/YcfS/YnhG family)